jgi:diguanylate cyclase (GGDEF)-like protein
MGSAVLLTPAWFPLVALASSLRQETWRTVLNTCVRTAAVCAAAVTYQASMVLMSGWTWQQDVPRVVALALAGFALMGTEMALYRRHLTADATMADLLPGIYRAATLRDAPAVAIGCLACVLLAISPVSLVLMVPVVGLVVGSLRDQERLIESRRDAKTGLLSMFGFRPQANAEIARAERYQRPLSLLMLDMDGLKSVNTLLGFLAGESVIHSMGRVLRDAMRTEDVVARLGGDEFALLLPDTDLEGAVAFGERLRSVISRTPLVPGDQPVFRTASIGLAQLAPGDTLDSLLDRADAGLRRAKQEGKNRIVVMDGAGGRTTDPGHR